MIAADIEIEEREREMSSAQNEGSNDMVKLLMEAMQKMTETMETMQKMSDTVVRNIHSIHSNRISSSAKPVRDKSRTSIN